MEVTRKQNSPRCPKKEPFLPLDTHTYVCLSEGKKYLSFGKFGALCFLVTFVLRFAALYSSKTVTVARKLYAELVNQLFYVAYSF